MGTAKPTDLDDSWLTPRRFAVILGFLVFLTFPGVVMGTQTFAFRDYGLFSYPVALFQRQCFWHGELPLWNPLNHCGMPFLAQWNTMALYPGSLIYLLLPMPWSLSSFCLAHLYWGGLGMFFLARHWTKCSLAAGLGGIIFAFNGLALNFVMWPSHLATFGWLPWVLWLVHEACVAGGRRIVWAVLAAAMQMLAGGPETILFTWGLLLLLTSGTWLTKKRPRGMAIPLRFIGITALVGFVCAAQLLPFFELLANSERHTNYSAMSYDWTMPLWGWVNFLVPLFRTHPSSQGVFLQSAQNWTSSYYAGIGTLWLVGIAISRSKDWRAKLLALIAFSGMLLALGDQGFLYRGLRFLIPALGFVRYPVKFVIIVLGLAPLLAAFGYAAVARDDKREDCWANSILSHLGCTGQQGSWIRSRFGSIIRSVLELRTFVSASLILILIGLVVAFDLAYPFPGEVWELTCKNALERAGILVLICICATALLTAQGRMRILCGCLLLGFFWLDLVTHMPSQNPTVPPAVYSSGWAKEQLSWDSPPRVDQGRVMLSPIAAKVLTLNALPGIEEDFRVKRLAFFCDCNLLDGVSQVHGFFSLYPGRTWSLTSLPYTYTNRDFAALLDFMAVSEVTSPGQLFGWTARPTAMPVVTAGQQPVIADDRTVFGELLSTNLDLHKNVFLPTEAGQALKGIARQPDARVNCREFTNQKVTLETHSPAPCLVVISQTWYPAWEARVDGTPAKLWRANYAFQAVTVPAGTHEVRLEFEDHTFLIGMVLTGLGLLTAVGLWWAGGPQTHQSQPSSS